jgi:hypothetical protein
MKSNIVQQIIDETPLETKLYVSNQMFAIHLIHELGFREDKTWNEESEEDNKLLAKLTRLVKEHTKDQLKYYNNNIINKS